MIYCRVRWRVGVLVAVLASARFSGIADRLFLAEPWSPQWFCDWPYFMSNDYCRWRGFSNTVARCGLDAVDDAIVLCAR